MSRLIPLVLSVALFIENLDATMIATSLPAIAADMGTTPVALKLALTAYYVALAVFVPVSAWLADRFGPRNVLRWAMLVFAAGSAGCALAGSIGEFVAFRFVAGMGGAMMTPIARLTLFRVTPRRDLVRATAWLTIPAVVAPMIGPPIGGFLATYLSWHWIFLVNIPVAISGVAMATVYLPHVAGKRAQPLDWRGFVLLAGAFAGMIVGLSILNLPVLPSWAAPLAIGIGIVSGWAYVRHARHASAPLIDLRVLHEKTFRATLIGSSLLLVGCAAMPFLVALMLQSAFGLTPFAAGMVALASAAGALTAKFVAAWLYDAFGFRACLTVGVLLSAAGIGLKSMLVPDVPIALIMALIFVNGLVRSVVFTAHAILTVVDVSDENAGQATAFATVARPVASALSIALAGGVLALNAPEAAAYSLESFHIAFIACAGAAALAVIPYAGLANRGFLGSF